MYTDKFGFLSMTVPIQLPFGHITPLDSYQEVETAMKEHTHRDGFLYPPMTRSVKFDPFTEEVLEEVTNSKRPAILHKLPLSHTIQLIVSGAKDEVRMGTAGLILYALSYLLGTRLQFEGWWVDARIPQKSTHHVEVDHATIETFLSHVYDTWKTWPEQAQHLFINILYMNSRIPSYLWEWEQFTFSYMVFDACFKLSVLLQGSSSSMSHKARFQFMCQRYSLFFDEANIDRIYQLRNELFHEALWDNSLSGMGGKSDDAFMQIYNLRRLNQRLIPALVNYPTPYIQSPWISIDRYRF